MIGFVSVLAGCTSGGQTGDEDALPKVPIPGVNQDTACPEEPTAIEVTSIDEVTLGGFSASDILQYAEGEFEKPLYWHEQPEDIWDGAPIHDISPRGDDPVVGIEIAYEEGKVRYYPPISPNPTPNTVCRGRLEIDVRVSLKTNDDAFNENVDAVLVARHPAAASINVAFYSANIEPEYSRVLGRDDEPTPLLHPIAGDLDISSSYDGGEILAFVSVYLLFSELGSNGRIEAWMYSQQGSLRSTGDIGTIGDICADEGYGFPLALNDPAPGEGETPSAGEVISLLNGIQWIGVSDDDVQQSLALDLALDFEYTAQSVCAQPDSDRNPLRLYAVLSGEFEVGSAEIDGSWPVSLRAYTSENGELESVRIKLNDSQHPMFDTLEGDWELTGLDMSSYDGVNIALDLQIEIESGLPTANGELTIRAYVQSQENRPMADTEGDVVAHLIIQSKSEP